MALVPGKMTWLALGNMAGTALLRQTWTVSYQQQNQQALTSQPRRIDGGLMWRR
jgi:hypothetical protein